MSEIDVMRPQEYTLEQQESFSPLRREINELSATEWAKRFDKVTAKIRKHYGIKKDGEK